MQNDHCSNYPVTVYDHRGTTEDLKVTAKQSPGKQSPGIFVLLFSEHSPKTGAKLQNDSHKSKVKSKCL